MKKFYLILVAMASLASCSNDDGTSTKAEDHTEFLNDYQLRFSGTFGERSLNWLFETGGFQHFYGHDVSSGSSIVPYLNSGLMADDGSGKRVTLWLPGYDSASQTSYENLFGPGEKTLGNLDDGALQLDIVSDGVRYSTECIEPGAIDILKIVYTNHTWEGPIAKVWLWVENADLVDCDDSENRKTLSRCQILLNFRDSRNF